MPALLIQEILFLRTGDTWFLKDKEVFVQVHKGSLLLMVLTITLKRLNIREQKVIQLYVPVARCLFR
jgi:hypothetical protein